jgi:hypothetical protein
MRCSAIHAARRVGGRRHAIHRRQNVRERLLGVRGVGALQREQLGLERQQRRALCADSRSCGTRLPLVCAAYCAASAPMRVRMSCATAERAAAWLDEVERQRAARLLAAALLPLDEALHIDRIAQRHVGKRRNLGRAQHAGRRRQPHALARRVGESRRRRPALCGRRRRHVDLALGRRRGDARRRRQLAQRCDTRLARRRRQRLLQLGVQQVEKHLDVAAATLRRVDVEAGVEHAHRLRVARHRGPRGARRVAEHGGERGELRRDDELDLALAHRLFAPAHLLQVECARQQLAHRRRAVATARVQRRRRVTSSYTNRKPSWRLAPLSSSHSTSSSHTSATDFVARQRVGRRLVAQRRQRGAVLLDVAHRQLLQLEPRLAARHAAPWAAAARAARRSPPRASTRGGT